GTTVRRVGSAVEGRGACCSRATAGAVSGRPGSETPGLNARGFLRTSTVTVFERPCEKLWRTCAVSTGLRSSSRPPPPRPRVSGRFWSCSVVFSFASLISLQYHLVPRRPGCRYLSLRLDHRSRTKAGELCGIRH